MATKKTKKSKKVSSEENVILRQSKSFISALKKSELPEYIDVTTNPWKVFFFSVIRGTGFGLGTLLGATMVITLLAYILGLLTGVPIIGDFFKNVAEFFHW